MPHITAPTLLVAAGEQETPAGELYDRAAGAAPVDVWYLPEVGHTAAIREVPASTSAASRASSTRALSLGMSGAAVRARAHPAQTPAQ